MSRAGQAHEFGGGMLPGAEAAVRGAARGTIPRTVAVVGGGLAGLACALRLAESGISVTVIETRKKLGGRATSFVDPRSGQVLDNCQHVLMGCCTNLIDFYRRLGVLESIEWHTRTYWANPPGAPSALAPGWLPAPAHFTGSFLGLGALKFAGKRAVARGMWKLLRAGVRGRTQWQGKTFAQFLNSTGASPHEVDQFWNPVVVSACNLPVDQVGAPYAMQVFQEGFLANRHASAMGVSRVPLLELYDHAEEALNAAGGTILLGVSASAIAYNGARVTGVITDEGAVDADAVVSAVPPDRLEKLVGRAIQQADSRLQHLDSLEYSPILGVHLMFAQRVMAHPHLVLPGRDTQWLFNKGVTHDGAQHIHAVISGAESWMALDEPTIAQRVLRDVQWALPAASNQQPLSVRSVKEKRATFAARPGVEKYRPTAACTGLDRTGGVRNLYLAGDWTRTGWPATMEGAVRSGYAAAGAIVGEQLTVADLRPSMLARLLGVAR